MKKKTSDAAEIFNRLFVNNDPEMKVLIELERIKADIAQTIYDHRKSFGLTQQELARRIGTTASAISRLEDTNCDCNHSITTLQKVAAALGCTLKVSFEEREISIAAPFKKWNCSDGRLDAQTQLPEKLGLAA